MSESETRQKSSVTGVTADRPLTKIQEDKLGYRDFATAVARGLSEANHNDGLVIAIHGKWGSGKTTAVNMAMDALERLEADKPSAERTIIVRFNPWWFSEQKDLTRAFFSEITASIGKRLSTEVRNGLRLMAKKATGATELVSSILAWTPAAPVAKPLAEIIKSAGDEIDEDRSLDDIRSDLAKSLDKEARSIVVIIDDVDRLPADEARQIFRLVKSVADLPRVTYLLVFDRDIATRGLERPSDVDSPEWLEKIIQVSFDLPPVEQSNLNNLFLERLQGIIGPTQVPDQVQWGNLFLGAIAPWLRTARDVTRLSNAIAMSWPAVRDEVYFADFIAIETMRLFEPKLYAFVRNNANRLTGDESRSVGGDYRAAFGAELLANVEPDRRKRAERALRYLFPRLDAVFANTWRGGSSQRAEREGRISSPRRFPVYFSLGIGEGIIPKYELAQFTASFSNPDITRQIVQQYASIPRRNGGTRAAILLNAISSDPESISDGDDEAAARALLAAADLFINPSDARRTTSGFPIIWEVSFAIEPLLHKLDEEVVARLIGDAINGPSPLTAAFFVTIYAGEHGRGGEKEAKPEDERRLSLDRVKCLERRLIDRIVRDAETGALQQLQGAASLIWWWEEDSGPEPVRAWVEANLEVDDFATWLMATFTSTGLGYGSGDMVGQVTHSVNRASLSKIVDVDRLATIAEQRINAGRDPNDAARNFIAGLNSRYN